MCLNFFLFLSLRKNERRLRATLFLCLLVKKGFQNNREGGMATAQVTGDEDRNERHGRNMFYVLYRCAQG